MFGLSISFSFNTCCGVSTFLGTWASPPSKYASWTLEDQDRHFLRVIRKILELCKQAKVQDFTELKGKPVELTLQDDRLVDWRILTEVL